MTRGKFFREGAAALALLFGAGQCTVVAASAAPFAAAPASQTMAGKSAL